MSLFLGLMQEAPAAAAPALMGGDSPLAGILPIALIFLVFYFLAIRPQQKRMREHQKLLESIRRGDKVLTGGGIIGSVVKVDADETLQVEIAPGVVVKVSRSTILNTIGGSAATAATAANDVGKPLESKKKAKGDKQLVANDNGMGE